MFQQNNGQDNQEPNPQQQQNNSQDAEQIQNENQDIQHNQNQQQNYFWRNVPYSEFQLSQKNQIKGLISVIEETPNDRFIHRQFLEKTCNKFQQKFLDDYEDVTTFEQLHQIIQKNYNNRKQLYVSQLDAIPNLIHDWDDKVKSSKLYQIMKIVKSPNRSLYISKDISKEVYFDEIKQNLNSKELEQLNNLNDSQETLKWLGIFNNFKVKPIQVLNQQMNIAKQHEFKSDENQVFFEIYKIFAFPYLYFNQCFKYDIEAQSVHFQLPRNINIEIKSNEREQIPLLNEDSLMSTIPSYIFQSNILSFLGIIDIFKLRIVCRYFKTMVEKYWYIPYKKEIIEYEIAKDLAHQYETLKNFQIAAGTLKQKLRTCIDMIMNFINWDDLHQQIEAGLNDIEIYRPLIMMLRLFNKQQTISHSFEINGQFSITELAKDIKQQILDYLNLQFLPLSYKQMKQLQQSALSAPEFNIVGIIHPEVNLNQLLTFLLQALYFHGWMVQTISIQDEILKKRKKELQIIDEKQIYNQNFLKLAYKYIYNMNEFQPSKDTEEQIQIMIKLSQISKEGLKSLNFSPNRNYLNNPLGVIQINNNITKIHLDIFFQIELLTYVCSRQKFYIDDIDDENQDIQFTQENNDNTNNSEESNYHNQQRVEEDKEQNYQEEEKSMKQNDPQPD
ncbi:unnamed protein product [Paramecium primaurelia]|uniref:F-box domain-containing protein n=1 Tax=Paramecium primaurelia TaxID=5886 RepID=A0A8S1LQJ5_PARPR|nr:unnamed protein product [Paramecium primaurelia]